MRRIFLHIGPLRIYSYAAMLYAGFVCGIAAGNYAANRAGLDTAAVFIAMLTLIVPALVGARALFVIIRWNVYRNRRNAIWQSGGSGAAMFGALPPLLLLSVPLLRVLRIPFGAFWDVATFTILVGLAFARVGCLLNGCCSGRPTTSRFSLWLPDDRGVWERRIPYQLIELVVAVALLVGAAMVWNDMPFDGALFVLILGLYSAFRSVADVARDQVWRPRQDRIVHRVMPAAISAACAAVLTFAR